MLGLSSVSSVRGLKSRKKYTSNGTSRIQPAGDTLDKIAPLCMKIGVTRIADITYMDKIYVPNYSAVLPGTEDKIWVYNGKGPTKVHAKASALMEAIERYSSLSSIAVASSDSSFAITTKIDSTSDTISNAMTTKTRKFVQGPYWQVAKLNKNVLHPREVVEPIKNTYKDNMIMDFLSGIDLLNNSEQILVPASLAVFLYFPKPPAINPFSHQSTNGLASGNVLEEAICHALCELIERDAASIAELSASTIPYNILQRIVKSLNDKGYPVDTLTSTIEDKFTDDTSIFPDVDISEIANEFKSIKVLVKSFSDANIPLLIKDITQKDIGIPTIAASSLEWITHNYGYFVYGYGTHPDARIALIRAITECSQTRVANIHGARDDLEKKQFKHTDDTPIRRWRFVPTSSSLSLSPRSSIITSSNKKKGGNNIVKFSEVKTYVNHDILDDIKLILSRLKKAGLKKAIIVDLTNLEIGVPVVRAIVPGLETFEAESSVMGKRAIRYFKSDKHTR